ncbi:MerR family transcriptional regulator [Amycolatopsis acidicola]|uniref:MerR family transcriptional regulator n=1 Tax=Amycolatopsis acidicola TaxID=2596893 RepID=A0A5N0VLH8_9PSEU|nr:MerR family transcriptional regulator [Amycolatopsis acidicola]KAA9166393.1 MerR family transcriptional regulator [Amycolatopsis acidicola]
MEPEQGAVWTAGQVARRLGIAPSTLRSWHRRYDVGPQNIEPGRYRRYTAEDVWRLCRMRDLVSAGMLPSDAAKTAASPGAAEDELAELVAAARALEPDRCLHVIEDCVRQRGVVGAWERLCRPALAAIDGDQREDPACVDTEHALSWAISAALHRVPRPAEGAPRVLLTCVAGEYHTLALEALSAALAERGHPARMLGAATPTASLARAIAAARPIAVVLWSQRPETADADVIRVLRGHPVRRILAGPGWPDRCPPGTQHTPGLTAALELLTSS